MYTLALHVIDEDNCALANGGCSDSCVNAPFGAYCECGAGTQVTPHSPKVCIQSSTLCYLSHYYIFNRATNYSL